MHNFQGFFFDLDDTLVAFDLVTSESWEMVCKEFINQNPYIPFDLLLNTIYEVSHTYWSDKEQHRIGRFNIEETRRQIMHTAFHTLNLPNQGAAEVLADNYSRVRLENMYVFPETYSTLSFLKAQGKKLVLITNGDSMGQRAKIRRFNLEPYFDALLIEEEMCMGKPDRRVFEKALSLVNLNPSQVMMVGDNLEWDIIVPREMGIYTVYINKRKKILSDDQKNIPCKIIEQLDEILSFI